MCVCVCVRAPIRQVDFRKTGSYFYRSAVNTRDLTGIFYCCVHYYTCILFIFMYNAHNMYLYKYNYVYLQFIHTHSSHMLYTARIIHYSRRKHSVTNSLCIHVPPIRTSPPAIFVYINIIHTYTYTYIYILY